MGVPGFVKEAGAAIRRRFRKNGEGPAAVRWPNPEQSIGPEVLQFRGKTFWESIGPAREAWDAGGLRNEVRDCITNHNESTNQQFPGILIFNLYMVGRDRGTAKPMVIFLSKDPSLRRSAMDAVRESRIMDNYPQFCLGAMPDSAGLIATENVETDVEVKQRYMGPYRRVLSLPRDPPLGRRIFVDADDGSPHLRPATGGPLLFVGGKVLQLTAGHAFRDGMADDHDMPSEPLTSDTVDLDGISDTDDDDDETPLTVSSPSQDARRMELQKMSVVAPASLVPKGHLFDLSELEDLDYALIELQGCHRQGFNRIPSQPGSSQRWLYITTAWEIGKHDIPIAAVTSSSGLVKGRLSATPLCLGIVGTTRPQNVFSIIFEGTLAQGDCGSPVIDRHNGHFYGYVVAGTPGGNRAYIMPAIDVIKAIEQKYGQRVRFTPPNPWGEGGRNIRSWAPTKSLPTGDQYAPVQGVELGSRKFFDEHSRLAPGLDFGTEFGSTEFFANLENASLYMRTSTHPLDAAQVPATSSSSQRANLVASRARTAYTKLLPGHVQHHHAEPGQSERQAIMRSTLSALRRGESEKNQSFARTDFQDCFFALPLELQSQILGFVDVPDILNLRLLSRQWNSFVITNDTEIAYTYLRQPHIPTIAIDLFPAKDPPSENLGYIASLWHRYNVASRLSNEMSEWIMQDLFLRRNQAERAGFAEGEALVRRRLVPFLLIVIHFFETYRRILLDPSSSGFDHAAIERQIIGQYDNRTLLLLHQVFPMLMAYQARQLRAPSYLGHLERSLRGYLSEPPPDKVHIAMWYLGGPRDVSRLTRIAPYEKLCAAVDAWHKETALSVTSWTPNTRLRSTLPRSMQWIKAGTRENGTDTTTSTAPAKVPARSTGKSISVPPTSLASGRPMGPLTPEETRLILGRLPLNKQQILAPTAEKVLLERRAVARAQDIKKNAGVLQELVLPGLSWLDERFYKRGVHGILYFGADVESEGRGL